MEKKQYIIPELIKVRVNTERMMALSMSDQSFDADLGMDVKAGGSFTGREGTVQWDDWGSTDE